MPSPSDANVTSAFIDGTLASIKRLNSIEDQVVKYTLFFELIRTSAEVAYSASKSQLETELENVDEEIAELQDNKSEDPKKSKTQDRQIHRAETKSAKYDVSLKNLETIKKELDTYFDGFSLWIKQPTYSPDHPVGREMMKKAEESLKSKS
jgi:hypothetical protein